MKPNPIIMASKCQNNISNEFSNEFHRMINIMKENINPQISKQIYQFNLQPDYNYISYFKYDIEFVARFILNRIEKAFEQINYDHFFNSISDCNICDNKNQTSRNCLKDLTFKENFIKTSIQMFNEYPLEVERKKFEIIDKFKKKNDVNLFTDLYSKFLDLFHDTKYFELEMQNLIKKRINYCCSMNNKKDDHKITKQITSGDDDKTDIKINFKNESNKTRINMVKNKQQFTNLNKNKIEISSKSLG